MTGSPEAWAPRQTGWFDAVIVEGEPVCRAHLRWEVMLAAPHPAGCAGATWRRFSDCASGELTAEPPAHRRLDPTTISRETAVLPIVPPAAALPFRTKRGESIRPVFLLVRQWRRFSRSRRDLAGAPGCGGQGRPRAAREAGCLDGRKKGRAMIRHSAAAASAQASRQRPSPEGTRPASIAGLGRAASPARDRT